MYEVGHKGVLKSGAPFEITSRDYYRNYYRLRIWNKDEAEVSHEWLSENEREAGEKAR